MPQESFPIRLTAASRRDPPPRLLEGKPLSARCTFLAYDAVRDLADLKHLEHLSDSVIEEYEESAIA